MSAEKSYISPLNSGPSHREGREKRGVGRAIFSATVSGKLYVGRLRISYHASVETGEGGCEASLQINRGACHHSVRPARYDLNGNVRHTGLTIDRVNPARTCATARVC